MLKITRKVFYFLLLFIVFVSTTVFSCVVPTHHANAYGIREFIDGIFGNGQTIQETQEMPEVYVGGAPLGFCLYCDGVVVIAVGSVHTEKGVINTIIDGEIYPGDIVKAIDE